MRWQMADGSFHEMTRVPVSYRDPNTVVKVYDDPWVIYSHVYHCCDEDCGDGSDNNWYLFGGAYLRQFIELKFWQIVIDDKPDERVFAARDLLQSAQDKKATDEMEVNLFHDITDDDLWSELDGWAGA